MQTSDSYREAGDNNGKAENERYDPEEYSQYGD
jgi:hypothetical protein